MNPGPARTPTGRSHSISATLPAKLYRIVVRTLQIVRFYHARNEKYGALLLRLIGPSARAGQFVVDLGCGPGGITSKLSGPYTVLGLDKDRYPLLHFFNPGIPRVQARAERLPFKDDSIDVVVAISLVEHVPDQRGFFFEVARVLKAGGQGIVQVPNLRHPIEPHTKWPFLHMWSQTFQAKVLAATGYDDLDLSTSVAKVSHLGAGSGLEVVGTLPIWHFRLAKLLGQPMGFFMVLRKPVAGSPYGPRAFRTQLDRLVSTISDRPPS